jgi:RHS repeat-associated protein
MQMPGRNSEGEYRYGFNGMELDDEVKGNGNSYDFGARLYDPRVSRWLSPDAYESKYPSSTPYNFAVNDPLLFIDPDGNDNVIYLIYHHDNKNSNLENVTAEQIAQEANAMYEKLGVNTRVVVFDESKSGKFNGEYMDETDAVVVVGDNATVAGEAGLNVPSGGLGVARNGTEVAGVSTSFLNKYKDMTHGNISQLIAFGLVHESGHLAAKIGSPSTHGQFRDVNPDGSYEGYNFMADGITVAALLIDDFLGTSNDTGTRVSSKSARKGNEDITTLMDLFEICRNYTNIENFNRRFGENKSTDNYSRNKREKEEQQQDAPGGTDYPGEGLAPKQP